MVLGFVGLFIILFICYYISITSLLQLWLISCVCPPFSLFPSPLVFTQLLLSHPISFSPQNKFDWNYFVLFIWLSLQHFTFWHFSLQHLFWVSTRSLLSHLCPLNLPVTLPSHQTNFSIFLNFTHIKCFSFLFLKKIFLHPYKNVFGFQHGFVYI